MTPPPKFWVALTIIQMTILMPCLSVSGSLPSPATFSFLMWWLQSSHTWIESQDLKIFSLLIQLAFSGRIAFHAGDAGDSEDVFDPLPRSSMGKSTRWEMVTHYGILV